MAFHVLTATCTGIHAIHHRKVALVQYDGRLHVEQLKINPRFKGLKIIRLYPHVNTNGKANAYDQLIQELLMEAKFLNAGLTDIATDRITVEC